jgi:hypothetical protein
MIDKGAPPPEMMQYEQGPKHRLARDALEVIGKVTTDQP